VTAKLVQSNEHPGGNVSGTSDMTPVEKEVDLIIALVPNLVPFIHPLKSTPNCKLKK